MTVTIDLTPELEARLKAAAAAQGTDEAGALRQLIGSLPPADEKAERLRSLFREWHEESEKMTPTEVAAEEAGWIEIEQELNA